LDTKKEPHNGSFGGQFNATVPEFSSLGGIYVCNHTYFD